MRRTVTFLFTDLENSTPLWEQHPELMQRLAARHDALLHASIVAKGWRVVELASLSDADLVAERVAAALDVREQPGRSLSASLIEYPDRSGDCYVSREPVPL